MMSLPRASSVSSARSVRAQALQAGAQGVEGGQIEAVFLQREIARHHAGVLAQHHLGLAAEGLGFVAHLEGLVALLGAEHDEPVELGSSTARAPSMASSSAGLNSMDTRF
jgi:flagellar motor component MotA